MSAIAFNRTITVTGKALILNLNDSSAIYHEQDATASKEITISGLSCVVAEGDIS